MVITMKHNNERTNKFFEALLSLKTTEECEMFFDDICTIKELLDISQRYEVAKMLDQKCVYTDIASKTGASSATIGRVNKCLSYGTGGYRKIIDRLKNESEENK